MATQRNNNIGNINFGLPSANNGSGLNRRYWMQIGSHIIPYVVNNGSSRTSRNSNDERIL